MGHEQQRGDNVDGIEAHDGRDDGHLDQNDIGEAEIEPVQTNKGHGDHATLRRSCKAYTAQDMPVPATPPAFRQISHAATAIVR